LTAAGQYKIIDTDMVDEWLFVPGALLQDRFKEEVLPHAGQTRWLKDEIREFRCLWDTWVKLPIDKDQAADGYVSGPFWAQRDNCASTAKFVAADAALRRAVASTASFAELPALLENRRRARRQWLGALGLLELVPRRLDAVVGHAQLPRALSLPRAGRSACRTPHGTTGTGWRRVPFHARGASGCAG